MVLVSKLSSSPLKPKYSNEELERLTEATEKEATENTEKIDYTKSLENLKLKDETIASDESKGKQILDEVKNALPNMSEVEEKIALNLPLQVRKHAGVVLL